MLMPTQILSKSRQIIIYQLSRNEPNLHFIFKIGEEKERIAEMGLDVNPDHCSDSISLALTPPTLTQLNPGTPLCPDIDGDVGEVSAHDIPTMTSLSSRGRWSPKDNDLASAATATVRTVLSSRIPRLPISFTPRFPRFAPYLRDYRRPPPLFPLYHPFSTFSASVSFHSPFYFLLRSASTTSERIFFLYRGLSMDDTMLTAIGGENST